jgi:hypothetical protein
MASALELHFYPGHFPPTLTSIMGTGAQEGPGLLLLLDGKKVLFRGQAYGGPSERVPVPGAPEYTPTPAGTFVLMDPAPYKTRTWKFSEIAWGTKLKRNPRNPNDVQYLVRIQMGREIWGSLLSDFSITADDIETYHRVLYGVAMVPRKWIFNAFGPIAVRFFKDTNNNRRLDIATESLQGAMFHTTAENEAEAAQSIPLRMTNSHGCIHMKPNDRDSLIGLGGLKAGLTLVIHPYTTKYGA